jgi:hypothetical protein
MHAQYIPGCSNIPGCARAVDSRPAPPSTKLTCGRQPAPRRPAQRRSPTQRPSLPARPAGSSCHSQRGPAQLQRGAHTARERVTCAAEELGRGCSARACVRSLGEVRGGESVGFADAAGAWTHPPPAHRAACWRIPAAHTSGPGALPGAACQQSRQQLRRLRADMRAVV